MGILLVYNLTDILQYDYLPTTVVFAAIYLLAKRVPDKHKIGYLLTISGCLQAFLMFLQLCGFLSSDKEFFPITGSFENPGPLGGYLAICFVATIRNYRYMNRWIGVVCSLMLGAGVIFSDSRAAWLAILVAMLYVGMQFICVKPVRQLYIFTLLLIVFGITSLTVYKPDSAKGRLMIWSICTDMIKDHPVCGQGFASFQREYMNSQANYIRQYPDSKGSELAVNNRFAFNEFLHIACEQGMIGLLLILAILAILFVKYIRQKSILFPCLITFVVFACFSYPCDVSLLLMVLALLLGTLSIGETPAINIQSVYPKLIVAVMCLTTICVLGYHWVERTRIEKALSRFVYWDDYESLDYICKHYVLVENSSDFMFRYARLLYLKGEYELAIPAVKQAIYLYPTTDKYCDLGDVFLRLEKYNEAEQAYWRAVRLLPNLAYPRYCLFLLYKEMNQKQEATEMARQILIMTPKKENRRYEEMKHCAKKFLTSP